MNIAITGAGIAGLATAVALHQHGIKAHLYERTDSFREIGLGFIILPNGISVLRAYDALPEMPENGLWLEEAMLQHPQGHIYLHEPLTDCMAVKRSRIIDALLRKLPPQYLHTGYDLCGYELSADRYTHACFANGEKIAADIFIAADGANSLSRKYVCPESILRQTPIEELVGIAASPDISALLGNNLLKTQDWDQHLSFGILPCNHNEVIWYMQYHSVQNPLPGLTATEKREFTRSLVGNWSPVIENALSHTDFEKVFCWKTRDMDPLPKWHHQNLVLAGDAAHLALPFTSQGTSSGLADADWLATRLAHFPEGGDADRLFTQYYTDRKTDIEKYLAFGRLLERRFLYPAEFEGTDMPLPLAK